ncbi:hypothetical protein ACOZ4I_17385 (plasmid) [Haloarcula salina]|uniref:hypothetical protein n=1 Tax=Haloarcula salina TaxID=1429914 RepID=UPI003C705805
MSAMTDGSGPDTRPPLGVLDVVRDREDDDADDAVVVNTPPVTCDEWVVHRHDGVTTVADDNPGYDAGTEVVVVAFRDELAEAQPKFVETTEALPLADTGELSTYAFPPGRLRRVATICPEDGDHDAGDEGSDATEAQTPRDTSSDEDGEERPLTDRLGEDMAALRDRLDDSGDVWVEEDDEQAVLVVSKLGEEYIIYPDGSVSDGPLNDRIADVAAEYLGGGSE